MNWTNWPETVMSSSAPKKAQFTIWRCGWGRGWGAGEAQENRRSGCLQVVQRGLRAGSLSATPLRSPESFCTGSGAGCMVQGFCRHQPAKPAPVGNTALPNPADRFYCQIREQQKTWVLKGAKRALLPGDTASPPPVVL